jgi:hypothetical protein
LILLALGQYPPQNEIDAATYMGKSAHFTVRPLQLTETKTFTTAHNSVQFPFFFRSAGALTLSICSRPQFRKPDESPVGAKNTNPVPNPQSKNLPSQSSVMSGNQPME